MTKLYLFVKEDCRPCYMVKKQLERVDNWEQYVTLVQGDRDLCDKYGVYIKQHNTDYLDDDFLCKHPSFGIHAANVAPEYGVAETKKLLEILEQNNLKQLKDQFIELCVKSNKWAKWVIDKNKLDDYQKTIISGHYSFSTPKFIEIKK